MLAQCTFEQHQQQRNDVVELKRQLARVEERLAAAYTVDECSCCVVCIFVRLGSHLVRLAVATGDAGKSERICQCDGCAVEHLSQRI